MLRITKKMSPDKKFNKQGHTAFSVLNIIIQEDSTILLYNVKENYKTGSTGVLVVLSLMCRLYRVSKLTQDLRATSIENIYIYIIIKRLFARTDYQKPTCDVSCRFLQDKRNWRLEV